MTAAPNTTPTPLQAALEYAHRGWRVVPIPGGQKHPAIPAWQTAGTTDTDRITHWWTADPTAGIGIVTGATSGIWVLDIDVTDGKGGDDTLTDLEAAYHPLPATYEVHTGSGGRHLYFTWPEHQTIRNNQSGLLGPGLDIRGEGGQVLAPPTIHPNGRPYTLEVASPTAPAEAPGWLLGLLAAGHTTPTPRPRTAASTRDPGAEWAAATPWETLLAADGWTQLRDGPAGEGRWCRPGKDPRGGPSATVGYGGTDVLKVFTSSHPQLRADDTYTKFGYLTATRHGGDYTAAARWCAAQGYGSTHGDARDLAPDAPIRTTTPPPATAPPAHEWTEPDRWPAAPAPPPFPLHTLPTWTTDHVTAVADQLQVPVDLTAMLAIGALSAACTGRAQVEVTPQWTEPVNLYLTVAMRSGAGKSPAEKAMTGWLRRWETERMAAAGPAHDEAQTLADYAARKARKMREGGIAATEDVLEAAAEAARAADAVPALPRLIVDDVLPEIVALLLGAHGERLAILSSEADLFDMLLRGKVGQRQNLNVFLKGWSGDHVKRDRKGTVEHGPESTILERPLLTISCTVQPTVLHALLHDPEMAGRGMAARFMYAAPTDLMGTRRTALRFQAAADTTSAGYAAHGHTLADQWARWDTPATCTLDDAARTALADYHATLEPDLAIGAPLEEHAEWVAKMLASVARYAGLLHLSEHHTTDTPITVDTMNRAIDLGRYWLGQAQALRDAGRLWGENAAAQELLEWVAETGQAEVTFAEIRRGRGDTAADLIPIIERCVAAGWLHPTTDALWTTSAGRKGKPSPVFEVWPAAVGAPDTVTAHTVAAPPHPAVSPTGSAAPTTDSEKERSNAESPLSKERSSTSSSPTTPTAPSSILPTCVLGHPQCTDHHTHPVDSQPPDYLFPAT